MLPLSSLYFGLIQLKLDTTVTIGDVLKVVGFLVLALAAYNKIDKRLTVVESKLNDLWNWWKDNAIGGDSYIVRMKLNSEVNEKEHQ